MDSKLNTLPSMIFAHANGFSHQCYIELHELLKDTFSINSIEFSPFKKGSDHRKLKTWHLFKEELIQFIETQYNTPVIALGHSLGAVSIILAAVERPELFSRIILMDPVILPKNTFRAMEWLPIYLKLKLAAPSKIAMNRRDVFESYAAVFDYYRSKKVFARLSDRTLRAYVEFGFVAHEKGVKLRYSKEWEARVYATAVNPWPYLPVVKVPTLAIRGSDSNVISEESWQEWKTLQSSAQFVEIPDSGHLVPLEQPGIVAAEILRFLK